MPRKPLISVDKQQELLVSRLCEMIGYGRVMQLASQLWHKLEIKAGRTRSGAFQYGPCIGMTVDCDHPIKDKNGHCEICAGSGYMTVGVKKYLESTKTTVYKMPPGTSQNIPKDSTTMMPLYNKFTGQQVGNIGIPDKVVEAAATLSNWLENGNKSTTIYGVGLVNPTWSRLV